jgi:uncharacterized membrane protein YbhN (UPF0104 family)
MQGDGLSRGSVVRAMTRVAQIKWKVPRQLMGTFHCSHNLLLFQILVQSVMLFLLFLLAFFLCAFLFLCHCLLPPYGIQKTGLTVIAAKSVTAINRVVKEANKRSYNFYRPNN